MSDIDTMFSKLERDWKRVKSKIKRARNAEARVKIADDLVSILKQVERVNQEAELYSWAKGSIWASKSIMTKEHCRGCQKSTPNRFKACCSLISITSMVTSRKVHSDVFVDFLGEIDPNLIDAMANWWDNLVEFVRTEVETV